MKLIVQRVDSWAGTTEYEIGEGKEYKTWYWSVAPTMVGTDAVNLIIKRWCHAGCRVEIPRERILSIGIETNQHHNEESKVEYPSIEVKPMKQP